MSPSAPEALAPARADDCLRVEVAAASTAAPVADLDVPTGPPVGEAARARFRVEGVYTASVARRVVRHLEGLPGVLAARLEDDEHLVVTYHASRWARASLGAEAAVAPGGVATCLDDSPPAEPRWRTLPRDVTGRTLVLATLGLLAGLVHHVGYGLSAGARAWALDVQAVLTLTLVVWAARPLILGAVRDAAGGRLGAHALPLLLGALVAALSLGAFFSGDAPAFEASLVAVGGAALLEIEGTSLRRRLEVRLGERPGTGGGAVRLALGGVVHTLPAVAVLAGDRLAVRAGDVVATDATVVAGALTLANGHHGVGSRVPGGVLVDAGAALIEARLDQRDSSIARAARRLLAAGREDPWLVAQTGRLVGGFAIASVLFAVGLFGAMAAVEGELGSLEAGALGAGLAVLAAAAPVAVARVRALGLQVALARAAERGVSFSGARAVARLSQLRELVFDKTGTLTEGRPRLVGAVVDPDVSVERALRLVAELAHGLDAPWARELHRAALERLKGAPPHGAVVTRQEVAGRGVVGHLRGGAVARLGTRELLRTVGLALAPGRCVGGEGFRSGPAAIDSAEAPDTVLYLAEGERVVARFHLEDPVRPEAMAAVRRLRQIGVDVALITADGGPAARKAAEAAGVARFAGDVSAADARAWVAARRVEVAGAVGVVGDGFEDDEAWRAADLAILVGAGRDGLADVVVVEPDLGALADAVEIAREARMRSRMAIGVLALYTIGASSLATAVESVPLAAFAGVSVIVSFGLGRLIAAGIGGARRRVGPAARV